MRRAEKSSRAQIRQTSHHQSLKNPRGRMASATGGRCGPRVPGRRRPPLSLLFLLASAFLLRACRSFLSAGPPAGRTRGIYAEMGEAHREGGGRREKPLGTWAGVSGEFPTRPGEADSVGSPALRANSFSTVPPASVSSSPQLQRLEPVREGFGVRTAPAPSTNLGRVWLGIRKLS